MDTVDKRATDPWLENLDKALDGRSVDYLVISHLEPDHASNIQRLAEKYPEMKLVGNAKIFSMLPQFFDFDMDLTEKELHIASEFPATVQAEQLINRMEFHRSVYDSDERNLIMNHAYKAGRYV